uniref:Uncharacterized protein n=1 Tax=Ditylenchus dipsaci TaxID=166011 RepID=A0A915DAR7_9BILA
MMMSLEAITFLAYYWQRCRSPLLPSSTTNSLAAVVVAAHLAHTASSSLPSFHWPVGTWRLGGAWQQEVEGGRRNGDINYPPQQQQPPHPFSPPNSNKAEEKYITTTLCTPPKRLLLDLLGNFLTIVKQCIIMLIPCVICSLGLDNSEEYGALEFETGANLRNHLVENHSKYVACALLAPNMNNQVHFWLLNNVDYNASLTGLQTNETQTKADFSDNDQNQIGLSLLSALISASTSEHPQISDQAVLGNENGECSKQSPTLHDLFNFNPLTAMLGDALANQMFVPALIISETGISPSLM